MFIIIIIHFIQRMKMIPNYEFNSSMFFKTLLLLLHEFIHKFLVHVVVCPFKNESDIVLRHNYLCITYKISRSLGETISLM